MILSKGCFVVALERALQAQQR